MNAKTSRIEDYVYISVICDATGMCARSSLSFKIFAQVRQFFSDFKHILWVCVNLLGKINVQIYFVLVPTVGLRTLYI